LLYEKKATVITSSGWLYRNGSPLAANNHQEPWIRSIFALIGVTSVDFVVADGLAEIERGKREREQYLRPIRQEVQRRAGVPAAV
jgi:FMN-dependent NADH-azoreductase